MQEQVNQYYRNSGKRVAYRLAMEPPVISALMLIEYVKCARAGGDSSRPIAMQEGDVEELSLTIRSTAPTLLPSSIIIALKDPSHSDLALPNSLHHPRTRPLLAGGVLSAFWYCWRRSHHARLSSESHAAATDSDTRRRTGGRLFRSVRGHYDTLGPAFVTPRPACEHVRLCLAERVP